ncbi:hypothetical protein LOTGIDRAFT_234372 [Lottia gigantea]|uniref:Uncharacterized protein n=1 Tax=Lottia gigantea TaxID=225164 RepID=V3ZWJ4_LOTGI|nr:hypothetical protein LOTGIDRAFT_234372 [Lottia gigantea]ESO88767.1 hypothetical protein LOTGIDRAFT_234372 [Lottia gigantea]
MVNDKKDEDKHSVASAPDIIITDTVEVVDKSEMEDFVTKSLLLPQINHIEDEHTLMGLAPRSQSNRCLSVSNCDNSYESVSGIRMTEIVPANSNIYDNDNELSWQIPIHVFSSKRHSKDSSSRLKRRLRSYYKAQNELISVYEQLQQGPGSNGNDGTNKHDQITLILSRVSFIANLLLLFGKAVTVALSSSLSIISSLVDSSVDLLSGLIIWWTSSTMKKRNIYLYPGGRTRLEPLAIVVLSVIMSLASFQIVIESIQKIVALVNISDNIPTFDNITIIIVSTTVVVKLGLFILCYIKGRNISSVKVLLQDHRNDTLSNLIAIICGYLGSKEFVSTTGNINVKFIDPCGAIIIGIYILISWWRTGWEQIKLLTGHTAKPDFLSKITWMCLNHHKSVLQIDTVRAFHFGNNFLVEVDIVLPEEMTLKTAHDIGEALQQKLEKLTDVERAFVHLDYESEHRPEEEHKLL